MANSVSENAALAEALTPSTVPVVFGPPDRALVGFYHAAEVSRARATAVVLCNPLGFEAMSAHRTYRHLAERLAAHGVATLRFDYDGTGDSSGRSDDPDRMIAWLGSIHVAVREVRARAGVRQVALVGVRFGATLAMLAAAEDDMVDGVVSWAPVISGRSYVNELRAFRLLLPRNAVSPRTDGGEEVGGYYLAAQTLADMSKVDLLAGGGRVPRRVLLLPRTERSGEESRLAARLEGQGALVRQASSPGYASMMREDPYEGVVPFETLDRIVEWMCEGRPPERTPVSPARPTTPVLRVAGQDGKPNVLETPVQFGPDGRLFGVLSEPDGPIERDRPCLCLLNVGANTHVGPHRMNVELARWFSGLGYRTFRFDVAGLGESPARPGDRENRIYTKDSVADVRSAMTFVEKVRSADRFVLIGLCSGAYLAFHTTIEDARVKCQILLSSYAFEWHEGDPVSPKPREPFRSTRFYARALLDRHVWLRAARGDVAVWQIAGALVNRLQDYVDARLPSWTASLLGQRAPQNDVERAFDEMCDRGTAAFLLSSFDDGGVDMIERYLGTNARKMRGRHNFSFHIVERADHTFRTLASQRLLRDTLTDYVRALVP
jgi:alpha-beta hydrolase superfamily lysophospholipase